MSSMQAVSLRGLEEEQEILVKGRGEASSPYSSRLAAAVSLPSGEVLVTGGRGRDRQVFLLFGPGLATWRSRASMKRGRLGHAAVSLELGGKEVVMVAGGWDKGGRALASVELFSLKKNQWQEVTQMQAPRVDFALQVR